MIVKFLKHAKSEISLSNFISTDEIEQRILKYNSEKASTEQNIPFNVFKDIIDIYLQILAEIIIFSTKQNKFPYDLKVVNHVLICNKKNILVKKIRSL